jgi:hypothetical protein
MDEGIEVNETNMGHMTGARRDLASRAVRVDEDARRDDTPRGHRAGAGASRRERGQGQESSQNQPRTVADVVRESTEMWLTSSDEFGYLVDSSSFNGINKEGQ